MTTNKPRRGNQRRGQFEAPGHYRTFYVKAWGAPHHRALSDVQEHVYLKLTIGPKACSLPGLVLLGRGAVGDLFKYDASVLDSALSSLQSQGNLLIDWPHQVIWAPFALLEQQYVASPKTATGWCSNLTNVPSASPLRPRIIADITSYLSMLGPSFVESLERLVGPEPCDTHMIPYQVPSIEPSQVPSSKSESQATPIARSSIVPPDTEFAAHVTQRQVQHDSVKLHSPTTLHHFVDFIRAAGLADDLTDLQRQSFAQLAESNRTMAHLRTALERTQRRATATRVANPVGYLLRTASTLPARWSNKSTPPTSGWRLEDIRQKWWKGLNVVCLDKASAWLLEQSNMSLTEAAHKLETLERYGRPEPLQRLLEHAKARVGAD